MAEITDEVLDSVAKIARISLNPEEKANLRKDIESILLTFKEIQDVKVDEDELYYVVDHPHPLREDGTPVQSETKGIMDNVPQKDGQLIKVPKGL